MGRIKVFLIKAKNLIHYVNMIKNVTGLNKGMEAVALAPTAMNQQKFMFELNNGVVSAKALRGFYSKIDLGIVKYHFEAVTGHGAK